MDDLPADENVVTFDDLDSDAGPFMDTAALMHCVDLVITSDTAVPHLAGALGVPVWMAVPVACDWRWLHGREDSPWYPTMRMFRQSKLGTWDDVFVAITEALRLRLAQHNELETDSVADVAASKACWKTGMQLAADQKYAEAEQQMLQAVRLNPQSASAFHDLAVVLAKQQRLDEAVDNFRRALELDPQSVSACGNLGLAFLEQDKIAEAISLFHRALAMGPNSPETFNNLAVAYMRNAQPGLAAENYQRALRLRPDYPEAYLNLSRVLLAQGDFSQGWIEYEWRWKCDGYPERKFRQPRWGGEPLGQRTLLLHAEQGLGDTLQFIRYANQIKETGGRVTVECQGQLVPLVTNCPGADQVIARGQKLPEFDVHAPLMSLPGLLRTTVDSVPCSIPYIFTNNELVEHWRKRLEMIPGFRVGISWQGNPSYDGDKQRSPALEYFEPLSRVEGVKLISLQKGLGVEQMVNLIDRVAVVDLGPHVDSKHGAFVDTAAIMKNLDMVITSDSAIAHLAGAMGIPVWLVLPQAPDFRWLLQRQDSPWYPTMRIFRQRKRGDWADVFQRVAEALPVQISSGTQQHPALRPSAAPPHRPAQPPTQSAVEYHREARQFIARNQFEEAIAPLEASLQADASSADVQLDLGVVYAKLKRYEPALQHLQQAARLSPKNPVAHANLGLALLNSGKSDEAHPVLGRAVQLDPAHVHRVMALIQSKLYEDAVHVCRDALRRHPDQVDLLLQLGHAQRNARHYSDALASYQAVSAAQPTLAEAHNFIGLTLERLNAHEQALDSLREAVRLKPDFAECWNNLGVSLADQDRLQEAEQAFRESISHRPDAIETHRNLGIALLLQGDLVQGWQEYEWRRKLGGEQVFRHTGGQAWDGAPLSGKRLFMFAEQGLGDTLQFVRYAKLARQQGAHVIVACQKPLVPILSRVDFIDELVAEGQPLPACDYYVPMLTLPIGFRTSLSTIPADLPYLVPDSELVRRWRDRIAELDGFKIGIAWQGNPSYAGDRNRSVPLEAFRPLANLDGVQLISLQKGQGLEQLERLGNDLSIHQFADVDEQAGAFMDTAAIMTQLDLIVTSDSAVAHLAGGLAAPTWMPLCRTNDWRWMRQREDSPWYPTMRLFRQGEDARWEPVFERIAKEVAGLCRNK